MAATVEALGRQVTSFVEQALALDDLAESIAVDLLDAVRRLQRDLRLLDSELETRIAAGHRSGDVVCDGRAVIRWSADKVEWDRDAARRAILSLEREIAVSDDKANAAVDPDTGEIVPTWEQALAVLQKYWLLGNPRTTPMKAAGLDPSEFRATSGGRPRVDLP